MIINIKATGMELTPAIRQYAEDKINSLNKFFDNIVQADIDVGMTTHHHRKGKIFYAEVNLHVPPHGKLERIVKEEEDLYKAIDKVKDHFKVELERMKEKLRHKDKQELRDTKEYQG